MDGYHGYETDVDTTKAETVGAFRALLPAHECSLTLLHNPHRDSYQSVSAYVDSRDGPSDFVSPEEEAAAKATGELWELQWYPETPVGFHRRMASSLEMLLALEA